MPVFNPQNPLRGGYRGGTWGLRGAFVQRDTMWKWHVGQNVAQRVWLQGLCFSDHCPVLPFPELLDLNASAFQVVTEEFDSIDLSV